MHAIITLLSDHFFNHSNITFFAKKFYKAFLEHIACSWSPSHNLLRRTSTVYSWLRAHGPPSSPRQLFEMRKNSQWFSRQWHWRERCWRYLWIQMIKENLCQVLQSFRIAPLRQGFTPLQRDKWIVVSTWFKIILPRYLIHPMDLDIQRQDF